jgi:hypothetical protein
MILTAAASAATQPDAGWPAKVAVLLLGLIAAAFLLDRLGLWMGKRGWICWRKTRHTRSGPGPMAGLLTEFQKLVEPRIEHRQQVMEERDESIGQRLGRGDDVDEPEKSSDEDEDEKKEVR